MSALFDPPRTREPIPDPVGNPRAKLGCKHLVELLAKRRRLGLERSNQAKHLRAIHRFVYSEGFFVRAFEKNQRNPGADHKRPCDYDNPVDP